MIESFNKVYTNFKEVCVSSISNEQNAQNLKIGAVVIVILAIVVAVLTGIYRSNQNDDDDTNKMPIKKVTKISNDEEIKNRQNVEKAHRQIMRQLKPQEELSKEQLLKKFEESFNFNGEEISLDQDAVKTYMQIQYP